MNVNTNQNHTTHLNVDPNLPIHQDDAVSTSSLPILTNSIEQDQGSVSFFERTFTSLSQSATVLVQIITVSFFSKIEIHLSDDFLLSTAMNANQYMQYRKLAVSSLLTTGISDFHKWSQADEEVLISLLSNPAYEAHQEGLIDLLRNPQYWASRKTLISLLCNPAHQANREALISLLCNPAYQTNRRGLINLLCNPTYQANREGLINLLFNPAYQANRKALIRVLCNLAYQANQEALISVLCNPAYPAHQEALISVLCNPAYQANRKALINLLCNPTYQANREGLINLLFNPAYQANRQALISLLCNPAYPAHQEALISMLCNPAHQANREALISLLCHPTYQANREGLINLLCNPAHQANREALISLLSHPTYQANREALISLLSHPAYQENRETLITLLCHPTYQADQENLINLLCNPPYEAYQEGLISLLCNPRYQENQEILITLLFSPAYQTNRETLINVLCNPAYRANRTALISLLCRPAYQANRETLITLLCNPAYQANRETLISVLCDSTYETYQKDLISLLCNPAYKADQENLINLLCNPPYEAYQEGLISLLCNPSYQENQEILITLLFSPAYQTNRETLINVLCNPAYRANRTALISLLCHPAHRANREDLISVLCNPTYQAYQEDLINLLCDPAYEANQAALISLLCNPAYQAYQKDLISVLCNPVYQSNREVLIQFLRINESQGNLEHVILFLSAPTSQPLIQFLSERSQEELEILFNYFNSLSFDPSNSSQENCIIVACLRNDISRKHRNTLVTIICGVLSNNPNITQEDLKNQISLLEKALSYDTNNSQDTLQKLVALFKKMNSNCSNASLNSCRVLAPLIQPFFEKTIIDHLSSDDALFFDNKILKSQIETNFIPMMDSSACSLNFEQVNKLLDSTEKSLSQIQADDPQRDFLANFEKFYRVCYLELLSKSLSQQEKKDFLNLDNICTWSALAKSKGYTDSAPRKNSSGGPVFWMEVDGNQERLLFQTSHEKVIIHLNQSGACTSIMSGQQHIYEVRDLKPKVALEIEKLTQNLIEEIPCSTHDSGNLSVLPNGLAINPVFYLRQVARILALNNQPNIHFLNPELVKGPGTDAGGLSRQFFTLLCRHLTKNTSLFSTEDLILPHMSGLSQNAKRIYCSLGMVMAYAATHNVVTGRLFSDDTIRQVIVCASDASEEALEERTNFIADPDNDEAKILSLTQKLFPEMKNLIDCLQDSVDRVSVETLHSLCEKGLLEDAYGALGSDQAMLQEQNFNANGQANFDVVEFKKQHLTAIAKDMEIRIIPLKAMGIGFLRLNPSTQLLDPNQAVLTSEKIQGQSFSRQVIADALMTDSRNQAIINKVQFLRNWILNSNTTETQIKQFIECCTGAPSLISNATIRFCEKSRHSGPYPSFHTCSSNVELNGSNETEAEFMDTFLKVMSWIGSSFDAG